MNILFLISLCLLWIFATGQQPTGEPSGQPTGQPSTQPTGEPSRQPSGDPSTQPTGQPSTQPTGQPSTQPTGQPSTQPTGQPSTQPSGQPSTEPTSEPSLRSNLAITWLDSIFNLTVSDLILDDVANTTLQPWTIEVNITSNREIYRKDGGHFRFSISGTDRNIGAFSALTPCVEVGAAASDVVNLVKTSLYETSDNSTVPMPLSSLFDISVKRIGDGKIVSNYTTVYKLSLITATVFPIAVEVSQQDCVAMQTVGYWNDPHNWDEGITPDWRDDVYFPENSGMIEFSSDVTVKSLNMLGGTLILQSSGCGDGWSLGPHSGAQDKCYKLYDEALSYADADAVCRSVGYGSLGNLLIQLEDYAELETMKKICRGDEGSTAFNGGCWMGLQDAFGTGYYNWRDPSAMLDISFRNWRRRSDRSDRQALEDPGTFINNGDNCVHLVSWLEDPMFVEQGSFEEVSCLTEKAFVCQRLVSSSRYTMTSESTSIFTGGGIRGGFLKLNGYFEFDSFFAETSATIIAQKTNSSVVDRPVVIRSLILRDGSDLILNTDVLVMDEAFIGETSTIGIQPTVRINSGFTWTASTNCTICNKAGYNVTVNARFEVNEASIVIQDNVNFVLSQGGELSSGSVSVVAETSRLSLGGYSTRLAAYDSFDVRLAHRDTVIGEYFNNNTIESIVDEESSEVIVEKGVYKLAFYKTVDVNMSEAEVTECIPYHASAIAVSGYVNALQLVQDRGGATVRRQGEGDDRFHFGYDYRIEIDAPDSAMVLSAEGKLSMVIYCVGIQDCGCAQTKVSAIDPSGQFSCPVIGNSSAVDSNACAIAPDISVLRISQLSYTTTSGEGSLMVTGGLHKLPADSPLVIGSENKGKGIVAQDVISWSGVVAEGSGSLIFTGKGWEGWDSSILIFAPANTKGRGDNSLNFAPSFSMTATTFRINDIGAVYTAGPDSIVTWGYGSWNGGIIGGRSTVFITNRMVLDGTGKSLRYACRLHVLQNGTLEWNSGNISLSDGANVVIDGEFIINVTDTRQYFGFAPLLSMPYSADYQNLLDVQPPLNDIFYFDDQLPDDLRGGQYINPLCGENCLTPSTITVQNYGTIEALKLCNVTFVAPINLEDSSSLKLHNNGYFNAQSGGGCGNEVFMEISNNAIIELSGGRFFMGSQCTITGDGELLGVAGTHDLSFSINAHITISGGIMRWPLSRGDGLLIRFYGGLLIEKSGMLLVEPWETTIVVDKEVHFKDDCILQFPMIGTAAQPSVYDSQEAPDDSPRGNFTSTDVMRWDGGTMRGKADFTAQKNLYLGGTEKRIRSLAKLVNQGHAEWSTGDIIMADQADFVNLGTVQMAQGSELFSGDILVEGTVIPSENGGDLFALDFHSWDLDQGALDFTEYVRLRTEFVSRAPIGWTEELDGRV